MLIYSGYWKLFSIASQQALADVGPKNTKLRSVYSPDLKHYLHAEPDGEPDHYVLYSTVDGKVVARLRKLAMVFDAVWSPDSNRFAVVGVPIGAGATSYREELVVYSVR